MELQPLAVAAEIIVGGNSVLMARRGPGDRLEGVWEFSGGKLEPGETGPDCLRRELREELGIESEVGDLFGESEYHCPGGGRWTDPA